MAKRKNHTNHNQNRKDHRNGIKRPRMPDFSEFLGLHPVTLQKIKVSGQRNKRLAIYVVEKYHPAMPLIIDTFEVPALLISKKLFRSTDIVELRSMSKAVIETILSKDGIYYVHKECIGDEFRSMRYYFNEIVEVFTNVQYINKNKKTVKYYLVGNGKNGMAESLTEVREIEDLDGSVDKTSFLPHLRAQEEEIVIFPDDDD